MALRGFLRRATAYVSLTRHDGFETSIKEVNPNVDVSPPPPCSLESSVCSRVTVHWWILKK